MHPSLHPKVNFNRPETPQQYDPMSMKVSSIDTLVRTGRQHELIDFFANHSHVPMRIADWSINVHCKLMNNQPIERKIVATPLSVRTRKLFKEGALVILKQHGYSDELAHRYYAKAWKKKYVWIPEVIDAVLEMVNAFANTTVLSSYEVAGDPRRTASMAGIPANPYLTTHSQFLVAVDMAKCILTPNHQELVEEVE